MPSVRSYAIGAIFMLIACAMGLTMSYIGGILMDGLFYNNLNGAPLVPSSIITYATTPIYNSMAHPPEEMYFINLYYLLCWFFPFLGTFIFWQSIFKDIGTESDDPYVVRRRMR